MNNPYTLFCAHKRFTLYTNIRRVQGAEYPVDRHFGARHARILEGGGGDQDARVIKIRVRSSMTSNSSVIIQSVRRDIWERTPSHRGAYGGRVGRKDGMVTFSTNLFWLAGIRVPGIRFLSDCRGWDGYWYSGMGESVVLEK